MKNRMKLVYIAGPYRAALGRSVDQNIVAARNKAIQMIIKSVNDLNSEWFPLIPHTNTAHFEVLTDAAPDQYYLDGTMALMMKCNAVLLVRPDADLFSVGTKAEVSVANTCNIPVFRTLEEFAQYARQPGLQSNSN